jgi:hypothetical protein
VALASFLNENPFQGDSVEQTHVRSASQQFYPPHASEVLESYLQNNTADLLASRDKRIYDLKQLLYADDTNTKKYHYGQDYGSDTDHDGDVNLTQGQDGLFYGEDGRLVTAENFICGDFARMIASKFGLHMDAKPKYDALPIAMTQITSSFDEKLPIHERDKGHLFNAEFIGGNVEGIYDFNNWVFFEPQTDAILDSNRVFKHLVNGVYMTIHLYSKEEEHTMNPQIPTEYNLVGFFLLPDGSVRGLTPNEVKLTNDITTWTYYNTIATSGEGHDAFTAQSFSLEEYSPEEVWKVLSLAESSGYLSSEEVRGILDDALLPPCMTAENTFSVILEK